LSKSFLIVEYGRQPKYDLKSPIILLRDEAKTSSIKEGDAPPLPSTTKPKQIRRSSTYSDKPIESSQEEFMDFVDRLLASLGKVPLSATDTSFRLDVPRTPSPNPTARERTFRRLSCREAIDSIVQRGLRAMPAKLGVFEIGKNGVTVATLTLSRTKFKLGETIEGVIDLEDGRIKCYQVSFTLKSLMMQVKSSLESAEDIDPAVSVRSQSSIYRATRRIHGTKSEFTTFARRVQFAFEIPSSIAPSFETSSGRLI
jgi:RAB6A-GEF complex partner protein 2